MKISIIGAGYVGLCTAVGFAKRGHHCTCIDIDKSKVDNINSGITSFYEEGLDESLADALKNDLITASQSYDSVLESDVIFICVGTPSQSDGSPNLNYVYDAADSIGNSLSNIKAYRVICVKSTVLPGTTESLISRIEKISGKLAGKDFSVVMNPEFLREGTALYDFENPDRIIIGEFDKKGGDIFESLYSGFKAPVMRTSIKCAEMIKYASNSFLATKISFINELGNLCKKMRIDVYEVARGMGYDKRISPYFLNAGCGFGGSCFPKDVSALASLFKKLDVRSEILNAVLISNYNQKRKIIEILTKKMDPTGKKICILGLSFKENSDDIRDSVSIDVIRILKQMKVHITAYDPLAAESMKKIFPDIGYAKTAKEALQDADACIILTAHQEFAELSDEDFSIMNNRIIIEGRKILDKSQVSSSEGVCW